MDDRLYKFIKLIEAGTYTKAAEELHISQPALTVAIQKLESQYKTPLLDRSGKQLELTPAGKIVYQAAQDHESVAHHLNETLQRLRQKRPSVTLGIIDSLADKLCISPAFDALERAADITLIINNSRYLREAVEKRTIAAALVIDDELARDTIKSSSFGNEQLQLVCKSDLADKVQKEADSGTITDFISYDRPSTTYRHIKQFLSSQGITAKTRLYSTSPSVMLGMVLAGKGCAVLPRQLCEPHITSGKLTPVLSNMQRPVALIQHPNTKLPYFLADFLAASRGIISQDTR